MTMSHPLRAPLLALATSLALAACPGATSTPDTGAVSADAAAAVPDTGPSCFTNPKTHVEIINACTSSEGIAKSPTLPLLLADGGLPPLP
jgi:hypothetical protein